MKTECGTAGERRGLLAQPPMILACKTNEWGGKAGNKQMRRGAIKCVKTSQPSSPGNTPHVNPKGATCGGTPVLKEGNT